MPNYDFLTKREDNFARDLEVKLIWVIYFIQIMFQLVIGLNFMIAIIESTFSSVNEEKMNFIYRNKAELNLESFEILQYFPMFNTKLNFRAIIFSTFVEDNESTIVVHGREDEINNLLENMKTHMQINFKQIKKQEDILSNLDGVFDYQNAV